jgi:hypothetical protein
MAHDPAPAPGEAPARGPRLSLKAFLLLSFCALAVVPAMTVVLVQSRTHEQSLSGTVGKVIDLGREAIESTGRRIADSSLATLRRTSGGLIRQGSTAIGANSDKLLTMSEARLQDSSGQIIGLSQQVNQRVTADLVRLSREGTDHLSRDLIRLSREANENLARSTAQVAQAALQGNSKRLIDLNARLGEELTDGLKRANQAAAQDVSQRLLTEVERDPLVNFRLLAQVIAQTLAGGGTVDNRSAYLADVDRRGKVRASTRYPRGTDLGELAIVRRALQDAPEVAAQQPLITFQDGGDSFLGVYTRKPDGGAVIVAYNLTRAQADIDGLRTLVQGSFGNLVAITADETKRTLSAATPRIQAEAAHLAREAATSIDRESGRISHQFADRMGRRAEQATQAYAQHMTTAAMALSGTAIQQMRSRSAAIIDRTVTDMKPVGKRAVEQAVRQMTREAQQSVGQIEAGLKPQILAASEEAAQRMRPAAERSLQDSRSAAIWLALGMLIGASLLGVTASVVLSRRIADPIEVEKKLKEAELARFGQEMEIATKIQTALVPQNLAAQDYDLAMQLVTATEVGGDLIDYLPQPDGTFWLVAGDVTGHGLTPGLIMMMAQSSICTLVAENPQAKPSDLLVRVNQVLFQNIQYRLNNDNYMTLQLVHHLGDGRFVASGFHLDVLIYRAATRTVESMETPGFWIGMLDDITDHRTDVTFELGPDDVMVLFTDGLIEAMNASKEQYDLKRLRAAVGQFGHLPAGEIQARILTEVADWMHRQGDDISLIVLKRHAAGMPALAPA